MEGRCQINYLKIGRGSLNLIYYFVKKVAGRKIPNVGVVNIDLTCADSVTNLLGGVIPWSTWQGAVDNGPWLFTCRTNFDDA